MKLELLLQFIIPLTFLAIWALTSLLNRDEQPLPPRPGAGRGPGGGPPRAGVGTGGAGGFSPSARAEMGRGAQQGRPPATLPERGAPARWSSAPAPGRPGAAGPRPFDEGIVILESENRPASGPSSFSPSSAAGARSGRGTGPSARKGVLRGRSTPAPPPRAAEPERPRTLTGLSGQSLSPRRGRALEITPLSTPISPISSKPLTTSSQTPAPEVARSAAQADSPSLSVEDLRAMLASPKRLREVALLGELLQPPVALRGKRRPN